MPAKVSNVAWKCTHCGKRKWLKPGVAKTRKFCDRKCLYEGQRVPNPVRPVQGRRLVRYGTRDCRQCGTSFDMKTKHQKFCDQECVTLSIKNSRRGLTIEPRPCETCGTMFTPRHGNSGRFHSRQCFYDSNRGERAPQWGGGRYIGEGGYVRLYKPGHPDTKGRMGKGAYLLEHRIVMEELLGRPLRRGENIHHKNGDRADNRPDNLELWTIHQPSGQRANEAGSHCATCTCGTSGKAPRVRHISATELAQEPLL